MVKFTHPVTARVTGDTKNMHHPFPVGTEVRVTPDGSAMPPCTGSWAGEDETFFVHEADLELVTGDRITGTIVDVTGDETLVRCNAEVSGIVKEVVVKVHDQSLAVRLHPEFEDQAYATGVYNVEQARELRDALDQAITALEGPETRA